MQCLQNMEIINLFELVKYHQCCKRGFEYGAGDETDDDSNGLERRRCLD